MIEYHIGEKNEFELSQNLNWKRANRVLDKDSLNQIIHKAESFVNDKESIYRIKALWLLRNSKKREEINT